MSKLPEVGTTIFTVMSQLAQQHNAINLSQGFPNFPVDTRLVALLNSKAKQDVHQYMPMSGFPELIKKVGELILYSYGRFIHAEKEILITAGATQGIFTTIMALIEIGDEVVILDPSYDCYEPAVILAGGKPVHVSLNEEFLPDWNLVKDTISDKTKMLIINNPHNPSGRIWGEADMTALLEILAKYPQIILLSDEVYEFITFDQKHLSINLYPELFDRTVIISSFGKTFHITGWKIGYLLAPEHLMTEIKKVHQFNVFCVNSVAQATLSSYLELVDVRELGIFYKQKCDLFASLLQKSRFKLLPVNGTYFQLAEYSEISSKSDIEFCKELTIEHGVAAIPISVFNKDGMDRKIIRFCFAKDDETLIKASDRLCRI